MRNLNLKLAITSALSIIVLLVSPSLADPTPRPVKELVEEQRAVNELLENADSVELGKLSARMLDLADRLLVAEGDAAARPYFEKGLEGNPWALDRQLTLGEIRARAGEPGALRERAEMVLRIGEEETVLMRATQLLGQAPPEKPLPLANLDEKGPLLVLVPIDHVSPFSLLDLREALSERLGIKAVVASVDLKIPEADRSMKTQWVTQTRAQLMKAIAGQPALAEQIKKLGCNLENLRTDDRALEALVRQTTKMEQGPAAATALDAMLVEYDAAKQWDVDKLMPVLKAAAGNQPRPDRLVLGVTTRDLFGGASNFLFGMAQPEEYLGLISIHRFTAAFNSEPPKRERLKERLLKQALSSSGSMIGVPRCNSPECARAYPRSLGEHDQKPTMLCPACRAGFERQLARKLSEE